jgi:hypothetical protein
MRSGDSRRARRACSHRPCFHPWGRGAHGARRRAGCTRTPPCSSRCGSSPRASCSTTSNRERCVHGIGRGGGSAGGAPAGRRGASCAMRPRRLRDLNCIDARSREHGRLRPYARPFQAWKISAAGGV